MIIIRIEIERQILMKTYTKEIIILLLQLLVFYILPLFAGPTDTMGLILLITLLTLIISLIYGFIAEKNIKYLYPVLVAIVFIPTIFIYYNESATIYVVAYLFISEVGLIIGTVIRKILSNLKK